MGRFIYFFFLRFVAVHVLIIYFTSAYSTYGMLICFVTGRLVKTFVCIAWNTSSLCERLGEFYISAQAARSARSTCPGKYEAYLSFNINRQLIMPDFSP